MADAPPFNTATPPPRHNARFEVTRAVPLTFNTAPSSTTTPPPCCATFPWILAAPSTSTTTSLRLLVAAYVTSGPEVCVGR
eukprot:810942-Rhodomonas_salina.3